MPSDNRLKLIQLWSTCLGNFFEHYDTALFGFLSPFLAPLIFPQKDPMTALILTYAMIPLGMLARPIGALVFGYIGDVYGRRQALFLTLSGMSIVSGCIALSPTYSQAGLLAPLIFGLGRVLQNFLASGETMGGAIFLLETASSKKHDLLSSFYGMTTIGGILLASMGVAVFSHYQAIDWGWRCLYLIGCFTAFFGCMIRRTLPSIAPGIPRPTNLMTIFWTHRTSLVLIAIGSGFSYATYSIALILMNGFIPLISPVTKIQMISLNTWLLVLDFCALPFFGWLSSKISREKMMLFASISVVVVAMPLLTWLTQASLVGVIGIRISFVLLGVAFAAPFHAWVQQLIPLTHRYAIISFGYAIGSQLLGGPTVAFSLWVFQKTGMISSLAWYWLILAILSSLALALSLNKKTDSLEKEIV